MKVYLNLYLVLISGFALVLCEVEYFPPGHYTQWREQLGPMAIDAEPDCKSKCNERCKDHKGVSICSSLLERIEDVPVVEPTNVNISTPEVEINHSENLDVQLLCPVDISF